MNSYHNRKEPSFSEPFDIKSDKTPINGMDGQRTKLGLSVHTSHSPGHTFIPVIKPNRPQQTDNSSSTEKQVEATMSDEIKPTPSTNASSSHTNGGFAFAPVTERNEDGTPAVETTHTEQPSVEEEKPSVTANPIERVIPAAAPAAKAMVEKVPSKYRRLLIVLLLLLTLLLVFFLLKPKTPETVENLQQGSSLPIEFRPVDEEEAKRAEAEAKALQEAQARAAQTEQMIPPATTNDTGSTITLPAQTTQFGSAQPTQEHTVITPKVTVQEPIKQHSSNVDSLHQSEPLAKASVKPTTAPQTKVETKAQTKNDTTKPTQPKSPPMATAKAAKSKTMTVPKGVSLMQVFRNHNLNIADVNAMSKANNIVSHLKVGEQVTVYLDKDNRVTEMSIGSGGKFIRQANGTYIYK